VKAARELGVNFFILGSGSNILIADKGFDGLVIKMENRGVNIAGARLVAESGAMLQKVIRDAIAKNLTGLEFLIGIPGTMGGGIAGNVGTSREWIGEKIESVTILDAENEQTVVPKSQCDFSYRFSRFKYNDKEIILAATFLLDTAPQDVIQRNIRHYLDRRTQQPVNQPCAGSIFKNPEGKKAWQLIDQVGLRGKRIGGAKISEEHANFIINTGNAKADDVVILISLIKQQARDELGIQLQEEIKYIGF
jgi:UDP-N-acetylmuramate dehydrogenase